MKTVISSKLLVAFLLILPMSFIVADSFKLKSEKSGKEYGPFEAKDGVKVKLGKGKFVIEDVKADKNKSSKKDSKKSTKSNSSSDSCMKPIALKEAKGMFDDSANFKITIGDKLKAHCKFSIGEFFGKKVINAGADLENKSKKTLFYSYNVAFFDANKQLIGCASQASMMGGVAPGKKTQLGSCMVSVTKEQLSKVKYYQVKLYESEKEVGK